MLTPLAEASDIKVHVTQYYNDEFFPTSTSGWVRARPKATGEYYVRSHIVVWLMLCYFKRYSTLCREFKKDITNLGPEMR